MRHTWVGIFTCVSEHSCRLCILSACSRGAAPEDALPTIPKTPLKAQSSPRVWKPPPGQQLSQDADTKIPGQTWCLKSLSGRVQVFWCLWDPGQAADVSGTRCFPGQRSRVPQPMAYCLSKPPGRFLDVLWFWMCPICVEDMESIA